MMNKQRISIMGCGWLGLPLAIHLQDTGHEINGSVREKENIINLTNHNLKGFEINFAPGINSNYDNRFFDVDLLFINIPPGRRNLNPNHFIEVMNNIIAVITKHQIKKIIFISSTSVYPDINDIVSEDNTLPPDKQSGKVLLESESMLLNDNRFITTILRFGGLIGGDRNPGRFLAGKQNVTNANAPVNLIHQDDCIRIISAIIKEEMYGDIFNVCMPEHPTRKDFYTLSAKKHNFAPPLFINENECKFKIVDSKKVVNKLNYKFKYSSPLQCI